MLFKKMIVINVILEKSKIHLITNYAKLKLTAIILKNISYQKIHAIIA